MQMLRDCDIWIHIQYIDPTKVLDHGLPEDLVRPSWLRWSHQPQQVAKTQKTWETQTAERVRKAFFGGEWSEWWFRVISLWVSGSHPPGRQRKHCSQMPAIGMIIATWLQDVKVFFFNSGIPNPLRLGVLYPQKYGADMGWFASFVFLGNSFEVLKFWTFKINVLELNRGRMEPT
jgi:hypothetical protein